MTPTPDGRGLDCNDQDTISYGLSGVLTGQMLTCTLGVDRLWDRYPWRTHDEADRQTWQIATLELFH